MTLSRQLTLIILVMFLLLFIGTFTISINNTRHYLINQLESHAQDTATSLGLSLTPHMMTNDLAVMNSMVDAIFDRGYYREVLVEAVDGKKLIERVNPVKIEGVPQWFIDLIPLETPQGDALINAGWTEAGTVKVSSHPGYAYDELWRTTQHTALWFLSSAAGALALGLLLIRLVLRPLNAVEEQAEAICNRSYPIQERIPRTRELRQVVLAMNKVSAKVKQMFEEQSAITENLRQQVYVDSVTGLGNRRFFDGQLQHLLQAREDFVSGGLLLFQLEDFKGYNDSKGYQAGDELLRRAARILETACADAGETVLARLTGADFAIAVLKVSLEDVAALSKRVCEALHQLQGDGLMEGPGLGHVGAAVFRSGQSLSALFANADQALRMAQGKGPNAWHLFDLGESQALPAGARNWRKFLEDVIALKQVLLHFQPIRPLRGGGETEHSEVLLRVRDEHGEILSAGVFMPMAERLGLAGPMDRLTLEVLWAHLDHAHFAGRRYAVNLTPSSIADPDFVRWLANLLRGSAEKASRLIFEVPEYAAVRSMDALKQLIQQLQPYGCHFSIDHFGRGFTSFAYLHSLRVDFLKIDGGYIRGIDGDKDNQFFVQALAKTAHEIDVRVIAENVETEAELNILESLYVDGAQGYLIGRPGEEEI
ncbi:MAG TPA: EAL domain-containing protein [Methylococcaceae bacterium]|nr:EAL domain-containing protein [Methylococcaceae bacterium]